MAEDKINNLDKLATELDRIVKMEKYKDDFYKDDDVTFKPNIKDKHVDEFMDFVYKFKTTVDELKASIEKEGLTIPDEIRTKSENVKGKAEEFYLKGSSNFKSGFIDPLFYINKNSLYFSVKTPDNFVDYATVTKTPPESKPQDPIVYGNEIADGIYVTMPIELDILEKAKPDTKYTVYLVSTSGETVSFNYTYTGK